MGGQYGYANIKKVVFFGLATGQSYAESRKAGTALGKAAAFMSALDEAAGLISLDLDDLHDEFHELDEEDKSKLMTECKDHFDLEDDGLEAKIEESLAASIDLLHDLERLADPWIEDAQPS